ncbi:DNA polymerase I [Candidatus Gracilibacteria bacterium CG17_big_fil_post_rev_8_21_14_2_50_48_13]|nr:MAG: DNA polymerase I [Candidatus Gracilibacteria bacterium CG17_big_fil_post_rev_8_21_14_2_50_48_13]
MANRPFDLELAAFTLDPNDREPSMSRIVAKYLDIELSEEELTPALLATLAGKLEEVLTKELKDKGLWTVYHDTELALVPVLARIESAGVQLDVAYLKTLSTKLHAELLTLEEEIYGLSGERFNIQSPKQLQTILFEKLGLTTGKKTKTGHSTNVQVLTELANHHPLPGKILEYRHLAKLLSTYIDTLPKQVDSKGRVHTTYNQTIASTGRLSSTDPNLQNIPIRTDIGRKIRQAFIPMEGCVFLAADYSQIELRLLAHFSKDPNLLEAFRTNEDIHTRTATLIFDKAADLVTPDERRIAKTVNFGVVYGMGPFKLATDLHISMKEAKSFIDAYFARYAEVSALMQSFETTARDEGYLTTILGRKKTFPGLSSKNRVVYEATKREAMNYPLQSSAADIIKRAMITLDEALREGRYTSRIVLQVHDELVLEVPRAETEAVTHLVVEHMQNAVQLEVPLTVSVGIGDSWMAAH